MVQKRGSPEAASRYQLVSPMVVVRDTKDAFLTLLSSHLGPPPPPFALLEQSGLWGGIALGRIVLAFALGSRLGERSFAIVLLASASVFLAIIWAVHNYIVNALAVVACGFFLGPVTPQVLSVVGKRVPPSLKSAVMSLTIGLGLVGSAVGPLIFGIAAGRVGLGALPGTLLMMCVVSAGAWSLMPKNRRRED